MGHARALLALPGDNSQLHLAREVKTRGLSVRETEALVKRVLEGGEVASTPSPRAVTPQATADVHTRAAEDKLKLLLGTRVRIKRKAKGGRIEIDFGNENELIRIFEALTESERRYARQSQRHKGTERHRDPFLGDGIARLYIFLKKTLCVFVALCLCD